MTLIITSKLNETSLIMTPPELVVPFELLIWGVPLSDLVYDVFEVVIFVWFIRNPPMKSN